MTTLVACDTDIAIGVSDGIGLLVCACWEDDGGVKTLPDDIQVRCITVSMEMTADGKEIIPVHRHHREDNRSRLDHHHRHRHRLQQKVQIDSR